MEKWHLKNKIEAINLITRINKKKIKKQLLISP